MVLGEAGALMLIETEEHAKARGAPILARVMGAAHDVGRYDAVEPDPSGQAAGDAIIRAIDLAGLAPSDIDHINAHATGTTFGDLAEARAIATRSATTRLRYMRPKRRWGIRWARPARWRRC